MENTKISKKRIFGSVVIGMMVMGYLMNAFDYTIPIIISYINHTSIFEATMFYDSSPILHLITTTLYILISSGIGAYVSKKRGLLVSLIISIPFIASLSYLLIHSIISNDTSVVTLGISYQLFTFIYLILVISGAFIGGYYGQKMYSEENDLDITNDKITLFGIRWFHYFWILPLIIYPFFSSFLIIMYSYIILFLSYFYIAIHPSLWGYMFSMMYIFFIPAMIYFSGHYTSYAFIRFFELMRYGQKTETGWRKVAKIISFGTIIPSLFFTVSAYAVSYIHDLPTPKHGDWKVALYIVIGVYLIIGIYSLYEWIKENIIHKNKSY